LADLELDIVDERAERHMAEAHRVSGLHVGVARGDDRIAGREAVRSEDIRLLSVRIMKERDARRAVRIVLDARDLGRDADLIAAKVDHAVAALMPATPEARGDAPGVITTARGERRLGELRLRAALRQHAVIRDIVVTTRRRGGL